MKYDMKVEMDVVRDVLCTTLQSESLVASRQTRDYQESWCKICCIVLHHFQHIRHLDQDRKTLENAIADLTATKSELAAKVETEVVG